MNRMKARMPPSPSRVAPHPLTTSALRTVHDPLSAAIDELGLRHAAFRRFSLRGAWGLGYGAAQRGIHLVERGSAVLRADGATIRIEAGDFVVVPRTLEHRLLASERGVRVVSAAGLTHAQPGSGPVTLHVAGGGLEAMLFT